jgi:tRNA-uridine 2-sulfurtransferase
VAGRAPDAGRLAAKTRYRQADAACTLEPAAAAQADGDRDGATAIHSAITAGATITEAAEIKTASATASTFRLRFEQTQWAVTPGQSAVLYAGDVCLGGGVIGAAFD